MTYFYSTTSGGSSSLCGFFIHWPRLTVSPVACEMRCERGRRIPYFGRGVKRRRSHVRSFIISLHRPFQAKVTPLDLGITIVESVMPYNAFNGMGSQVVSDAIKRNNCRKVQ